MKNNLNQLIEMASATHLKTFLKNYSRNHAAFRQELESFLAEKYVGTNKKTIDDYCKQMQKAFLYTDDFGDHWNSFLVPDWERITEKANSILKKGTKLLEVGNANAAASIAVEFFDALDDTYDEDYLNYDYDGEIEGEIGNVCEEARTLLLKAIQHPEMDKDILQTLMGTLQVISDGNLPYDLSNYSIFNFDAMLLEVSQTAMSEEDVLNMLDAQIEQYSGQYNEYEYVERKINYLRQHHRDNDALAVIRKYIYLPKIRKILIDEFVSNENYQAAIQLVDEGIDLAREVNKAGNIREWKVKKLEIYEQAGDKQRQIDLCSELFLSDSWTLEYYHKLKALVPASEWKKFLADLIDKITYDKAFTFGHSIVADIYVEEKEADKLYELIMSHGSSDLDCLDRYAKHTGKDHAAQLLEIYTHLLKQEAARNVNIKSYTRIAEAMSCMNRLHGGKNETRQLAQFFRQEYSRRPRMMESISKF